MDKCASIVMFLEKQSGLFLDTANQLAGMARETLVIIPLPVIERLILHIPFNLKSYLARFELRFPTSTYRQQQRF